MQLWKNGSNSAWKHCRKNGKSLCYYNYDENNHCIIPCKKNYFFFNTYFFLQQHFSFDFNLEVGGVLSVLIASHFNGITESSKGIKHIMYGLWRSY